MAISKEKRQLIIKKVITENEVETQEQLVSLLKALGLNVTQATISRDIKELHLIKVLGSAGKMKYQVLEGTKRENHLQKLKRKIEDVVIKIDCVNNLILLKTLPGNAHVIGVLLDDLKWDEMIGCVCGNDTCLIISKSQEDAQVLYERMLD